MKDKRKGNSPPTPAFETFFTANGTRLVCILVAVFAIAYCSACIIKFRYFLYWDIDLAHHVQECHNILHGSLDNTLLGINFLGNHFALIMFPITGVYAIFKSPVTLLILQVLAAASAAFPIYFMFRKLLNETAALALAFAYLAHPAIGYTVLYEFHPVVFAGAFFMWALWAFPFGDTKGRYKTFVIFALLGLASRENLSLLLVMLGIYAAFFVKRARMKWAITSLGLGLAWFVVVMLLVMPRLNEGKVGFFNIYKHEWGDSLPKITGTMLSNPAKVVRFMHSTPGTTHRAQLDTKLKRIFYGHVLLPALFLSLLSPSTLLLLAPVLAQQMLSARIPEHNILRHYTTLLLPVVMVSAGMGLRNLLGWLKPAKAGSDMRVSLSLPGRRRKVNRILAAALVCSAIICHVAYGPLGPGSVGILDDARLYKATPMDYHRIYRKHWNEMVRCVPPDVPVVSTFAFQARLADRKEIYSYHHLYKGTYTLTDEPFPMPEGIQAALIDFNDLLLMGSWRNFEAGARMREFLKRERLTPVMSVGASVLFERDTDEGQQSEPLYEELDELGNRQVIDQDYLGLVRLVSAEIGAPTVTPGGLVPVGLFWRSSSKKKAWLACRFHMVARNKRFIYSPDGIIPLGHNLYLPFEWPRRKLIRQNISLPLPEDIPEDLYSVSLTVYALSRRGWVPLSVPTRTGAQPIPPVQLGVVRVSRTEDD